MNLEHSEIEKDGVEFMNFEIANLLLKHYLLNN